MAAQSIKLAPRPPSVGQVTQLLRKLEAVENSLNQNAKIVIPSGSELVNVIGEMAGVLPLTE